MIDLMMSTGQEVTDFLERMIGGPLDLDDLDELSEAAFLTMAGSTQPSIDTSPRVAR